MTINQLHKITSDLIAKGAGRRAVCIAKDTFSHPLEPDGCTILDVESAELKIYELMDADGGSDCRKDGTVKTRTSLTLFGGDTKEGWGDK